MKGSFRKLVSIALAAFMAMSLTTACSGDDKPSGGGDKSNLVADTRYSIKYAENFNIQYFNDNIKIVTDTDNRDLLLVPTDVEVPAGFDDAILVRTPLTRAFYGSTTHVGMMGALERDDLYDSIIALSTEASSWTIPQITERYAKGQITYVPAAMDVPEAEVVLDLDSDMYFTVSYPELGRLTQYEELGIIYAGVGEWMEKSNPAYMEWIKFFAAFYNLDELADQVFEAKMAHMAELRDLVKDIPEADRPVVAYAQVYDGRVYTQASDSTTAKELWDAGAVYFLDDLTSDGALQIGMEEFFDRARDADILIYTGMISYVPDMAALLEVDPLFGEMKAFQDGQIYIFAADYYMNSASKDVLFEDMVTICHPELMPRHELRLVVKLPS